MGRYDKLKIYYHNGWRNINEITSFKLLYPEHPTWGYERVPLGRNDSDNTNELYYYTNHHYERITLDKRVETVITDAWIQGSFNLLPASGFCWCPNGAWKYYNWYFRAHITKTASGNKRVFYCGDNNTGYIAVYWQADGTIKVDTYKNQLESVTTSNSVAVNTEAYLNIYSNARDDHIYIEWNNVTTNGTSSQSFIVAGTNTVGDTGLEFRDAFAVGGVGPGDSTYTVSFDASTASGSDGNQYTNVNHREVTQTVTNWV